MIEMSLDPQHISRTTIRPLHDYLYNDNKWMQEVQKHVDVLTSGEAAKVKMELESYGMTVKGKDYHPFSIGIIGHDKDASSWYLKAFPQWDFIEVGHSYVDAIDASTIRDMWLGGQSPSFTSGALNRDVHSFIYTKFPKKEYERLVREYNHIRDYKEQWKNTPYPVIFQTVDAVVVQSGHILFVRRKAAPGEGLIALPGGFVGVNETIENAMIRELREETRIKVPDPVLRGCIKARHVFDAPGRSLRGRTITNGFLIELPAGPLPKVKGSDDALVATWTTLADFEKMEDQTFEDHHYIGNYFLGRV